MNMYVSRGVYFLNDIFVIFFLVIIRGVGGEEKYGHLSYFIAGGGDLYF